MFRGSQVFVTLAGVAVATLIFLLLHTHFGPVRVHQVQLSECSKEKCHCDKRPTCPTSSPIPTETPAKLTIPQLLDLGRQVSEKRPLNLIFQMNFRPVDHGGQIFETDWIQQVIFGSISRPVRVIWTEDERQQLYNDSVYVFLFHPSPPDLFQRLKDGGYVNYGGYHMGDEQGAHDISFYGQAWFMFRNYYFDRYQTLPNTIYIPLGVKAGLAMSGVETFIPASKRKYQCNFIGSIRSNRAYMIDQLHYRRQECLISADKPWADPSGMHVIEYRQVMLDSRFTLCPFGNNEESMRFYEALEAGSIPIAETSKVASGDFINQALGGDCPVPRLQDWNQLDEFLQRYHENPTALDALQKRVLEWWSRVKSRVFTKVQSAVDAGFQRAYGK